MTTTHKQEIRRQFGRQAANFNQDGLTLSSSAYLQWVVERLNLNRDLVVLDVAAGTGHLGRAIAPKVRRVIAVDMTPEMLEQGRREADKIRIDNISFEEGFAEKLRYPDNSFDMVVTRLSLHHFTDPKPAISEMVRVCSTGGQIGVMDMISPDDADLAARYNLIERLRDPSHTRCLMMDELQVALARAGVKSIETASRNIEVNLDSWMNLTGVAENVRRMIREELTADLEGKQNSGMRPFIKEGQFMFTQTWTTAVGFK